MQALAALILAAFVGYIGAWYFGAVQGNFALLLLLASFVTGVYWLAERLYFLPRRKKAAAALEQEATKRNEELVKSGISQVDADIASAKARVLAQPWWLDWTAGLFPVIITVFLLRSFLFEPFKIPSGSMIPTLMVGDLILVNKFEYGLRLPLLNTKITAGKPLQRGDVVVFRYPPNPNVDYIKRVIGLPGDEVAYINKRLSINGQLLAKQSLPDFFDEDRMRYSKQFEEDMGNIKHRLLNDDSRPPYVLQPDQFEFKQNCRYSVQGVVCKVPAGHYFMMGDNRDDSLDSRYWGFVPDQNIVGRAFFVWMNFGNLKRIGPFH